MKQIASNYAYSPATNVVTLTGVNIDADQLLLIVAPGVGRTLYNFASVTGTVVAGADTRVTLNASTAGLTTTSPLVIFYDDQASAQAVTGTVALDPASLVALENITVTVGSSVALAAGSAQIGSVTASISNFPATQTVAGTVTVGNFPASQTVAGTVTANMLGRNANYTSGVTALQLPIIGFDETIETADAGLVVPVQITNTLGVVGGSNALPISGTVTANVQDSSLSTALDYYALNFNEPLPCRVFNLDGAVYSANPLAISGTVTANIFGNDAINGGKIAVKLDDEGAVFVKPQSAFQVEKMPSGALTTRFGSVTTANTSQITSAVTNTNRKYLLAQNISAGTVTIGIGFSPTTTQGIQLTAGAGLTFDSFCPTGAVYWLGAVTGAAFTILEG